MTQRVPSPKPGFDATHPEGRLGAITPSKSSEKVTVQGVGVGVGDGVPVAVAVTVGVGLGVVVVLGVAVAVGVGVPVHTSGAGPWIATVSGVPALKKPIVASVVCGGRLAANRKL